MSACLHSSQHQHCFIQGSHKISSGHQGMPMKRITFKDSSWGEAFFLCINDNLKENADTAPEISKLKTKSKPASWNSSLLFPSSQVINTNYGNKIK